MMESFYLEIVTANKKKKNPKLTSKIPKTNLPMKRIFENNLWKSEKSCQQLSKNLEFSQHIFFSRLYNLKLVHRNCT